MTTHLSSHDLLFLLVDELRGNSRRVFLRAVQQLPQLGHERACVARVEETGQINLYVLAVRILAQHKNESESDEFKSARIQDRSFQWVIYVVNTYSLTS